MVSLHMCGSCRDSLTGQEDCIIVRWCLDLHSSHKESLDAVDRDAVRSALDPWESLS